MASNFIRGVCRTNLDGYEREEWPTLFVAVPRKGERVEAKSGRSLVVVSVTHTVGALGHAFPGQSVSDPYILIELHKGY